MSNHEQVTLKDGTIVPYEATRNMIVAIANLYTYHGDNGINALKELWDYLKIGKRISPDSLTILSQHEITDSQGNITENHMSVLLNALNLDKKGEIVINYPIKRKYNQ